MKKLNWIKSNLRSLIKNKKTKFTLILILFLVFIGGVSFAQQTPDAQRNIVDWAQGGSILEDWFMKDFLKGYKQIVWGEYATFINMAKAIGAALAILYFALKSYEMMVGDKKLEVLPLLRPFMLCLIIIFWKTFITVVSFPSDLITNVAGNKYHAQQREINKLRYKRADLQSKLIDQLYKISSEAELAAEEGSELAKDKEGWFSRKFKSGMKSIIPSVLEMKQRMEIGIQLVVTQVFELLALWILRIAVYSIFLLQVVYSGILIMLGPFSVAMSIHPSFKDSFTAWVSRFISVTLYSGIAFLILFVCAILQHFALEAEINRFNEMLTDAGDIKDMTKILHLKSNGIMSFGIVIVCFLLSAVSIFTVPSISTWIVSTSGATSAVSTVGRGVGKAFRIARGGL